MSRLADLLPHWLMIRWHRWRVFHAAPGTGERHRAVVAYLSWNRRKYGRLD